MKQNRQSAIVGRVATLVSGSFLAQIVAYLTLPYITRIYTPETFTDYAQFLTATTIIGSIAALRYEVQIPIARSQQSALALFFISIASASIISIVLAAGIAAVIGTTSISISIEAALVPLAITIAGMQSAFSYWAIRCRDYRWITRNNVLRAVLGSGIQVGAGLTSPTTISLITGLIVKSGLGFLFYGLNQFKKNRKSIARLTWRRIRSTAIIYKKQPSFSTLEALANSTASYIPIIVGSFCQLGDEVGQMMLALQIMQAPAALVDASISQAYLSEGTEKYRDGVLAEYTLWVIRRLMWITVLPLVSVMGFWHTHVFRLIFGNQWGAAAEFARMLIPAITLQMMVSPVSVALQITGGQRIAFLLQAIGLIMRIILMIWSVWRFGKAATGPAYAIGAAIFYGLYLIVVLKRAKCRGNSIHRIAFECLLAFLISAVVGLLTRIIF